MTCPHLQSKMVGIIWMVPIYSVDCVLSLLFPEAAIGIGMLRDCYEAYVLYLFLAMLLAFLCNDDESQMVEYLDSLPLQPYPSPFQCCFRDLLGGKDYIRFIKFGTLQYCLVRPMMAIFAFISSWFGMYEEGNFDPLESTYLFIVVVTNISVILAFSSLLSFYHRFKYDLRPFNPVPKFMCIKCIIFCIYWQGLVIALLLQFEVLSQPSDSNYSKASFAVSLQDFVICVEMAIAALANYVAFDFKPFAGEIVEEIFLQKFSNESLSESLLCSNGGGDNSTGNDTPLPRGYRRSSNQQKKLKSTSKKTDKRRHSYKALKQDHVDDSSDAVIERHTESLDSSSHVEEEDFAAQEEGDGGRCRSSSSSHNIGTPLLGLVSNEEFQQRSLGGGVNKHVLSPGVHPEKGGLEIESSGDGKKRRSEKGRKRVSLRGFVDKNFAHNAALRDFNETMPIVLPTGFEAKPGTMIKSNPKDRIKDDDN